MSKKSQTQYYPTSVRIGDVPYTIMSDEDLLLAVRLTGGDDLHDLVQKRVAYVDEMPDKETVLNIIDRIQSDVKDVVNEIEQLYDMFEN